MDETFDKETSDYKTKLLHESFQEIKSMKIREDNLLKLIRILNDRIESLEIERDSLGESFVNARKLISIYSSSDNVSQQ